MAPILQLLLRAVGGAARAGSTFALQGSLRFKGLAGKRKLKDMTQQEILNALKEQGLRESTGSGHFVQQLKSRGPVLGIHSLDDFARAFNRGTAVRADATTIKIITPNGHGTIVMNAQSGRLVSVQDFGVPL